MAVINERIEVTASPAEAYALILDFSRAEEWDPGVPSARVVEHVGDGPGLGSRYALKVQLGAIAPEFVYETTRAMPPTDRSPGRIVHETKRFPFAGVDTIEIMARDDGGSVILWNAEFKMVTPIGSLFDPVLQKGFEIAGKKAVEGLEQHLGPAHAAAA